MDQKLMTKVLLLVFTIGGVLLMFIGISYAFFTSEQFGLTDNILKTGTVVFSYNEGDNAINIFSNEPVKDDVAKVSKNENSYFDFSVTYNNRGQKVIDYDITLLPKEFEDYELLEPKFVKVYLTELPEEGADVSKEKNGVLKYFSELDELENGSRIIKSDTLEVESRSVTKWYRLRVWLPEVDSNGKKVTLTNDTFDPVTGEVVEKGTADKIFSVKTGVVTK